jgi:hypothetical protein
MLSLFAALITILCLLYASPTKPIYKQFRINEAEKARIEAQLGIRLPKDCDMLYQGSGGFDPAKHYTYIISTRFALSLPDQLTKIGIVPQDVAVAAIEVLVGRKLVGTPRKASYAGWSTPTHNVEMANVDYGCCTVYLFQLDK